MIDYDKRILVTGCLGFIGSHLVRYLANKYPKYQIIGFDAVTYCANEDNVKDAPENFLWLEGDIRDIEDVEYAFAKYNITDVIHLAAESHVDNSISNPSIFVETNVNGTVNILNIAKCYWDNEYDKHRFYHVSTDEVYGALGMHDKPFNEETKYNPHSPYSASKAASDHFVRAYHDTYGMNNVISNCSNNYGPNQYPEKLIPKAVKNLCEGKNIPIYAKGENVRDWLYVEDHCEAIDKIFHEAKSGETYNIGGNNEHSNIDLVKSIIDIYSKLTGKSFNKLPIEFVEDRKGHDFRYAIDSSKLQRELSWNSKTSFNEGLEKTIKSYIEKFLNFCD